MPVIKRVLKDNELSSCNKIYERIRVLCGTSEEDFYGSNRTATDGFGMCCNGIDTVNGFMNGLRLGLSEK